MKPQSRVLTISRGRSDRKDGAWFIGTIYRGGKLFEGVIKFYASIKDCYVSEEMIDSILRSRHRSQIRVALLDGFDAFPITVEGLKKVFMKTSIPVIALEKKRPAPQADLQSDFESASSKPRSDSPYRVFYKPFILHIAGLNHKEVLEFARIYLRGGKNPPILNSTRAIAKAYNVFQERVKRQSRGYRGRKDRCVRCEVLP